MKLRILTMFCICLIGCDDIADAPPIGLDATPVAVNFGAVQDSSCVDSTVWLLNNTTSGPFYLRAVLDGPTFALSDSNEKFDTIKIGYEIPVTISFCPKMVGIFRDTLKLFTTDSTKPIATVSLVGSGY